MAPCRPWAEPNIWRTETRSRSSRAAKPLAGVNSAATPV
jgi:hypothetical protein